MDMLIVVTEEILHQADDQLKTNTRNLKTIIAESDDECDTLLKTKRKLGPLVCFMYNFCITILILSKYFSKTVSLNLSNFGLAKGGISTVLNERSRRVSPSPLMPDGHNSNNNTNSNHNGNGSMKNVVL